MGTRGGALGLVVLKNDANIKFDFNIEGTSGVFNNILIDGKSKITGVNISVDLTSATSAPGVQLQNIGGNFSLKNWTPMGFVSTKNSSYFEKLPYETLNPFSNHTSGTAIMSLSLSHYKNLSRSFSSPPQLNIGINSGVIFGLQSSPNSRSRILNNSKTIKY